MTTFADMSDHEIDAHVAIAKYGDFVFSDGVRPAPGFVAQEGYKIQLFDGRPALFAALSQEKIFDSFRTMLDVLDDEVMIFVRDSHEEEEGQWRYHIDKSVMESVLIDFENLIVNNGFLSIAISDPDESSQLQLDEHKLICFYTKKASKLQKAETVMQSMGISRYDGLRTVIDGEHIHGTVTELQEEVDKLKQAIGIERD